MMQWLLIWCWLKGIAVGIILRAKESTLYGEISQESLQALLTSFSFKLSTVYTMARILRSMNYPFQREFDNIKERKQRQFYMASLFLANPDLHDTLLSMGKLATNEYLSSLILDEAFYKHYYGAMDTASFEPYLFSTIERIRILDRFKVCYPSCITNSAWNDEILRGARTELMQMLITSAWDFLDSKFAGRILSELFEEAEWELLTLLEDFFADSLPRTLKMLNALLVHETKNKLPITWAKVLLRSRSCSNYSASLAGQLLSWSNCMSSFDMMDCFDIGETIWKSLSEMLPGTEVTYTRGLIVEQLLEIISIYLPTKRPKIKEKVREMCSWVNEHVALEEVMPFTRKNFCDKIRSNNFQLDRLCSVEPSAKEHLRRWLYEKRVILPEGQRRVVIRHDGGVVSMSELHKVANLESLSRHLPSNIKISTPVHLVRLFQVTDDLYELLLQALMVLESPMDYLFLRRGKKYCWRYNVEDQYLEIYIKALSAALLRNKKIPIDHLIPSPNEPSCGDVETDLMVNIQKHLCPSVPIRRRATMIQNITNAFMAGLGDLAQSVGLNQLYHLFTV